MEHSKFVGCLAEFMETAYPQHEISVLPAKEAHSGNDQLVIDGAPIDFDFTHGVLKKWKPSKDGSSAREVEQHRFCVNLILRDEPSRWINRRLHVVNGVSDLQKALQATAEAMIISLPIYLEAHERDMAEAKARETLARLPKAAIGSPFSTISVVGSWSDKAQHATTHVRAGLLFDTNLDAAEVKQLTEWFNKKADTLKQWQKELEDLGLYTPRKEEKEGDEKDG